MLLPALLPTVAMRAAHAQEAPVAVQSDAYRVEIDAPYPLGGLLRADLDLLRWRTYDGMNRDLLERLVAEAQAQLTETLATEGYFAPVIERSIGGDERPWTVRFQVDPGPATRVSEVRIAIVGSQTRSASPASVTASSSAGRCRRVRASARSTGTTASGWRWNRWPPIASPVPA